MAQHGPWPQVPSVPFDRSLPNLLTLCPPALTLRKDSAIAPIDKQSHHRHPTVSATPTPPTPRGGRPPGILRPIELHAGLHAVHFMLSIKGSTFPAVGARLHIGSSLRVWECLPSMAVPGHPAAVATPGRRMVQFVIERCQTPEGASMAGGGFNSVCTAFVHSSLNLTDPSFLSFPHHS